MDPTLIDLTSGDGWLCLGYFLGVMMSFLGFAVICGFAYLLGWIRRRKHDKT